MSQQGVVYLDGFKLSLQELGLTRETLNHRVNGRIIGFMLDDEMRDLYRRAKDDPESLSPAEKNRVFGRIPPEDEERLCQERLGCTKEQLYERALTQAEDMSMLECDMVTDLERIMKLPAEDRDLVLRGREAIKGPAILRAAEKRKQYTKVRAAEARRRSEELKSASLGHRAAWVQDMVDRDLPRWGFVVMRTEYSDPRSDEAWKQFQERYETVGKLMMQSWSGRPPKAELWLTLETVFVSDAALDGASANALRERFKSMREGLPEGIRRDCFLVQDKLLAEAEWLTIRAVNPDFDPEAPLGTIEVSYESQDTSISVQDLEGFSGEIQLPLSKVFDWLHYSLLTDSETWERRYKQTTQKQPKTLVSYWPYPEY
ncbi:hypothetical protein LCI18_003264 [Fusarium solani-melongenae]|uniref:Uncharacterized protein n=1 Tax=Fusarium solani subsp. cucurbitae TaxID=2747967 RepID=A0ACD3YTL4_FUSSC|nr:hypothetical protein LCI18_003264 [Fusarium solani-melongenae]